MNKKTTLILIGILIILFAGIGIREYSDTSKKQKVTDEKNILSFDTESVDAVTILENEEETILQKSADGAWLLASKDNFPADTEGINNLIFALSGSRATNTVANSLESASDFLLDDNNKITVSLLSAGAPVSVIHFGMVAENGRGMYANVDGSQKIILINNFNRLFMRPRWESLTVQELVVDNVTSVEFVHKESWKDYSLTKKEGEWFIVSGANEQMVNGDSVNNVLQNASFVEADEVPAQTIRFDDSGQKVTYKTDARELSLTFGQEEEELDAILVQNAEGRIYWVDREIVSEVFAEKSMVLEK